MKFTDSLIVSSSSGAEEIQVWEPKTLAPYEPIVEKKFISGGNCLNADG
jgi:hypothetical protein